MQSEKLNKGNAGDLTQRPQAGRPGGRKLPKRQTAADGRESGTGTGNRGPEKRDARSQDRKAHYLSELSGWQSTVPIPLMQQPAHFSANLRRIDFYEALQSLHWFKRVEGNGLEMVLLGLRRFLHAIYLLLSVPKSADGTFGSAFVSVSACSVRLEASCNFTIT